MSSSAAEVNSLTTLLKSDRIELELLPQKKGLIKKHVEYNVSSERFKSQVCRRFNDFLALHELLVLRYPYRLVPRLPPQKLAALMAGVDSGLVDNRKRGLRRWLVLVSAHPVFSADPLLQYFLTYMGEDHASSIRDQFRHLPDEFVTCGSGHHARDDVTPEMHGQIVSGRQQIAVLTNVVGKTLSITEKMVERSSKSSADLGELGRELTSLTNQAYLSPSDKGSSGWESLQQAFHVITKEFADVSSHWAGHAKAQDKEVCETLRMFQDVLFGYKDLCDRLDKNLTSDHKKAMEKITNIKKRKLLGILSSDPAVLQKVESTINDHEIILNDLEARQSFSALCMSKETQLVFIYTELLGDMMSSLARVEVGGLAALLPLWKNIQQNVQQLELKTKK